MFEGKLLGSLTRADPASATSLIYMDIVENAVGTSEERWHGNTSASVGKVLAEVLAARK
jgi:hypothetical protein